MTRHARARPGLRGFPSPLVGEGARAKRRRVRGLSPRTQTPHPARTSSAPPSPTRGEGKKSPLTSSRSASRRTASVARMEPTGRANARPMTGSAKSGAIFAASRSRTCGGRLAAPLASSTSNSQPAAQGPLIGKKVGFSLVERLGFRVARSPFSGGSTMARHLSSRSPSWAPECSSTHRQKQ